MRAEALSRVAALVFGGLLLLPVAGAPPAQADLPITILQDFGLAARSTGSAEISALQTDLLWLGHYDGTIDGTAGPRNEAAIKAFQTSLGEAADGHLSAPQRALLSQRAAQTAQGMQLSHETSRWTGIAMQIPHGLVMSPRLAGRERLNLSYAGLASVPFSLHQYRWLSAQAPSLQALTKTLIDQETSARVLSSGSLGAIHYVYLQKDEQRSYSVFQHAKGEVRGVQVWVNRRAAHALQPVLVQMLGSLDLFAAAGVVPSTVAEEIARGSYPGHEGHPEWFKSMTANGSGSLVSTQGHVLTNHHVAIGCGKVTVNGHPAHLIGADLRADLAVLQVPQLAGREPIALRTRAAQLGEPVLVMGYPVFNVSRALNVTDGIVSSTAGLQGDAQSLQITAPVQPGNSGGPVLDGRGRQIAVVVSKPGKDLSAQIENIAWVLRADVAARFLARYDIRLREDNTEGAALTSDQLVRAQRDKALRIECH